MKPVDYKLFFSVLILIIFGMIMISSVSVYSSFRVTDIMAKSGYIEAAYNHFYVLRNISHVLISLFTLGILVKVPYRYFEQYAKYFLLLSVVLLIIVLIIGPSWNGARGWINVPFLPFAIQPTEFLKFSLIVYLSYFFKQYKAYLHTFSDGFIPFMLVIWVVVMLVGAQPDFGTILVVVPVSFMMFFVAGANVKHLFLMMFMALFFAFSIYLLGDYDKETWKNKNTLGYITQRIDNFFDDNKEAIENKTINYQTEQALIAIGSGGFAGLWFGNSIQKFGYLPEVQGDFIFSVIVEELGFVGAFILLSIYGYIGYRGCMIARSVDDLFAQYAAMGISSWILLQACINIGVNLNIVPLTGITLPFVSYGGSSLLSLTFGLALLLNISRHMNDTHKITKYSHRKKTAFKSRIWA
jgi:cell division protein FtsW